MGAFPKLHNDNLIALHEILEDLDQKKDDALTDESRKLRDFYRTAMDESAVEQLGATPLTPWLKKIDAVGTPDELIAAVGQLRATGIGTAFSFYVGQDEKHSDRYAVHLEQGGLGLPDRDYYVGTSEDSQHVRKEYREHVAKMLRLLGDSPQAAEAGADTVLRIETKLAEKSRTPVQLRDREAQYNKMPIAGLEKLVPNVNWNLYLKTIDLDGVENVIVGQPEFFTRVNDMWHSVKPAEWRTYLRWHLVHSVAPYLSSPFENENFRFYSHELRGVKEMQPRWKRVVATLDGEIGEALGKLYVERHFPPAAKKRMDAARKEPDGRLPRASRIA